MASHAALSNFSGGEVTPQLDARLDLQKYESSLLKAENVRPLPWGGVSIRPGTVLAAPLRSDANPARPIPFNYSTDLAYVIEMTPDGFLRFYYGSGVNAGTQVAGPYEIAQPYAADELFDVKFRQINGVMYLTHPAHEVQKLVYAAANSWSIAPVAWKYPPLLDQNATQAQTLALGATTGNTTLTAAGFTPFVAGHVGSYWEVQHLRDSAAISLPLNANGTSSAIEVVGQWSFVTSQYWYGSVQLQASYDSGSTWQVIRKFMSGSDGNFSTSGTELAPNIGQPRAQYRINYAYAGDPFAAPVWTGAAPTTYATAAARLVVNDTFIAGLVKVTAFTDSTHVNVTVIVPAQSTAASYLWSEGAFSAVRGYPTCVDFYEQRLLYSGVAARPNTIYGSVIGDFDNMQLGSSDDSGLSFQPAVAAQNTSQWIASLLRVHVGTSGEELNMASGNLDEPITPSNITIRRQSTYGSTGVDAMLVNNSILFVERNGQRLREMRELSPYVVPTDFVAPDLTLFAAHLFSPSNQIIQMDFGRLPDPLIYCVRSDGTLCVMTYNREQNIMAWARYVTDGLYEGVCVVEGSPADEVWVTVKRTVNGSTKRFMEVFTTDPAANPDKVNNCLLDCAVAKTQASSVTVNGLSHLNGNTVSVVANGNYVAGLVVSGGVVTLPVAATIVRVGIPYTATVQTMKRDSMMGNGTSQGRPRRISQVVIRFKDSLGCAFASSASPASFEQIPFRNEQNPLGSSPPLFSGDVPVPWPAGMDFDGSITVRQTLPFPFCVLGLFPKADSFGE